MAFSYSLLQESGKWVRYDLTCHQEVPVEFSKEYAVACCVRYASGLSGRTGIRISALGTINILS